MNTTQSFDIDCFIEKQKSINVNDIENIVDLFIEDKKNLIYFLCRKVYGEVNNVSLPAFKENIKLDLKNALITLFNSRNNVKKSNVIAYLTTSLKNSAIGLYQDNKNIVYVCPACKYFGQYQTLSFQGKELHCYACENELINQKDQEKINLYKTFIHHSRKGYGCPDCNRFIPKSLKEEGTVACPYLDCFFSGNVSSLHPMKHPVSKKKIEECTLDNVSEKGNSISDKVVSNLSDNKSGSGLLKNENQFTQIHLKEELKHQMTVLLQTIEEQKNAVAFKSNDSTRLLKTTMYEAYLNCTKQYPDDMLAYLVHQRRNNGYQHRIFQEFIKLLEKQLPFSFVKNGKIYNITSLQDPALSIFYGETTFTSKVTLQNCIENETTDLYIGSRKGSYCKSYYLGKLIDIVDVDTKMSLLDKVKDYTFFRINMDESIPVGTEVQVTHLKIPPHYQMGGMVYLNRIRRAIVDRVYFVLNGKKRVLSR